MPNFEGKFLEYLKSVIFKGDGSVSGGTGPTYPHINYLHATRRHYGKVPA